MRRRNCVSLRIVSIALAVLTSSSCQDEPDVAQRPLPPAAPVILVTAREYSFELPDVLPAGRVVFRTLNAGTERHDPSIVLLDDDVPPIDVYLRQPGRRPIRAFAGVNPREPGDTGTFAVDLVPGRRYAFVCFIQPPGEERHAEKGMAREARTALG